MRWISSATVLEWATMRRNQPAIQPIMSVLLSIALSFALSWLLREFLTTVSKPNGESGDDTGSQRPSRGANINPVVVIMPMMIGNSGNTFGRGSASRRCRGRRRK
jgi:hypothetical protein